MPLLVIPAPDAIKHRRLNEYATWPNRSEEINRVEPIAKPGFDAAFKLIEKEKIYTIGSCFARNIELFLEERGYDIPVRRLKRRTDLKLETDGILNNFSVPSILQELEWAFDSNKAFDPETGFYETAPGKFIDLNLPPILRPETFDLVLARRQAIIEATREISSCRVIIITLGLAEVWYDNDSQRYLNETPRNSIVQKNPNRFDLRILEYNEILNMLQKSMDIIKSNAAKNAQILLTISPVPLNLTHRNIDVITANTYSKSVLRAAAEAIALTNDFVHYYPSYESIILSDRQEAWLDDMVHVTPNIVSVNVNRMISAYSDGKGNSKEEAESAYSNLLKSSKFTKWNFLEEHIDLIPESQYLTFHYAQLAIIMGYFEKAIWAINQLPEKTFPYYREVALGDFYLETGEYDDALSIADQIHELSSVQQPNNPGANRHIHRIRYSAYIGKKEIAKAVSSVKLWSEVDLFPGRISPQPFRILAKELKNINEYNLAKEYYHKTIQLGLDNNTVMIEYADTLIHLGQADLAREVLDNIEPSDTTETRLKLRLLGWLPDTE